MIRKLDLYVLRVFVVSLAVAFLFAAGVIVLTQQLQYGDDLISAPAKLRAAGAPELADRVFPLALRYYACQITIYCLQFAPFLAFFAALFTAARLHRANETVAMLASGVSLHRGFAMVFVAAGALAAFQAAFREIALPHAAREAFVIRRQIFDFQPVPEMSRLSFVDGSGSRVRFDTYRPTEAAGEGLDVYSSTGGVIRSLKAETARWETGVGSAGSWSLTGVKSVVRSRSGEVVEAPAGAEGAQLALDFDPGDCEVAARHATDPQYLSIGELDRLARRMPANTRLQVLLHAAITAALANLILPLLGLPCVLRLDRRSTIEGAAFAFALCVVYFAATLFFIELGVEERVGPVVAAWLPVVLFGSLGIAVFESMPT